MYSLERKEVPGTFFNMEILALQFLLLPTVLLVLSAVLFAMHVSITVFHFLGALAATVGLTYFLTKKFPAFQSPVEGKTFSIWKVTALFIILILVSIVLSMYVYDFSQDGQAYHQPAVIALKRGWNPFYHPFLEKSEPFYKNVLKGCELFIDHYAKGSWINAASVYRLTGSLESGKCFNFLFLIGAFLVTWNFLQHFSRVPRVSKILLAGIIALNPVSLSQLFTFYVDTQLASVMTIFIVLGFQYILFREKKAFSLMFLALISLINIKFTGLVYGVGFIGLVWLVVFIIDRDFQREFILMMSGAFLIGVGVIGFQPYITNTIHKGNPFYPAVRWGESESGGVETVLSHQAPKEFLEKNRLVKFFYSLFSYSDNLVSHAPRLKIPFSTSKEELQSLREVDARYGGFGPFFGGILLLLIAPGVWVIFKARKLVKWFCIIFSIIIVILTLINPEAWWARISPQFWMFPFVFIVSFYYLPGRLIRWAVRILLFLLVLNCGVVMISNTGHTFMLNSGFRAQAGQLSTLTQQNNMSLVVNPDAFYLGVQNRLQRFDIRHRMVNRDYSSQNTMMLIGTPNVKFWLEVNGGRNQNGGNR